MSDLFKQKEIATYLRGLVDKVKTLEEGYKKLQLTLGFLPPQASSLNLGNPFTAMCQAFKITKLPGNSGCLGDCFEGKTWDGTTTGEIPVAIARPYLLRRTPFDGKSINGISYDYTDCSIRTATDDLTGGETVQEIYPPYVLDEVEGYADVVYAYYIITGTNVLWEGDKGPEYEEKPPIQWLDLNVDGRFWREPSTQCVPGKVVSGTGKLYQVQLYPNGPYELPAEELVTVDQLQIKAGSTINVGTWVVVYQLGGYCFMRVATWM